MASNQTGSSTTTMPYLVPTNPSASFTSVLTAGDTVPGSLKADGTPWRMVGTPDGLGVFDNGNGTFTVLMNHELGSTQGIVRAHGSAGSFVDKLVIDTATLTVLSAGELVRLGSDIFTWDAATSSYVAGTTAWNRFCSGDLPQQSALYDQVTGLGTQNRIYFTGEEQSAFGTDGPEGRPFAFIATGPNAGKAYELPKFGNMGFENIVLNANTGARTIAMMQDDQSPGTVNGIKYDGGQVYVYAGDKQAAGTDIEKAGLSNGKLYGIVVPALAATSNNETIATNFEAGTPFTVAAVGNNGDVSGMNGAQLQTDSEAKGVAEFLRPEDGAWDTVNPNRYYFITTDAITSPSRLWALDFVDAKDPTKGGTLRELLNGTEGQVMLDNMTVGADGKLIIQEDPGNNARVSKVWQYDPATDTLTEVAQHDPARFSVGGSQFITSDEESSGVIDVSAILGSPGRQAFLLDTQAHNALPGEIVEGGQLQVLYVDRTINGTTGNDTLNGSAIDDRINAGDGNDTVNGRTGTNLLAGGNGDDTAVFDFSAFAAGVGFETGLDVVTGPGSKTYVSGFEHYQFTDAKIDVNDGGPLVDDLFYVLTYKDVLKAGVDPDTHFATFGWREGRDPDALFSTLGYLAANPDVRSAGVNPLQHYDRSGWKEGRDPSAGFDNEFYLAKNPDVKAAGVDPLQHYLQFGQAEGRSISEAIGRAGDIKGGFDPEYYLLSNPDVAKAATAAGGDTFAFARSHFETFGWKEGRDPNAVFDTKGYLAAYGDVKAAGINPLTHYDLFGWKEGRDPAADFDTSTYLGAYKDVAAAGVDPMAHYLQFGIYEGRSAFGDGHFQTGLVG